MRRLLSVLVAPLLSARTLRRSLSYARCRREKTQDEQKTE